MIAKSAKSTIHLGQGVATNRFTNHDRDKKPKSFFPINYTNYTFSLREMLNQLIMNNDATKKAFVHECKITK